MTKNKNRFVLVLSDTHIGSTVGLWPEGIRTQAGADVPPSPFQKWLWECWMDMQKWVAKTVGKSTLTTVFNGDCIEGNHHRTTEIMTPNLDDQYTAALKVFEDIAKLSDRFYLVKGTECHVGGAEATLGSRLGGIVNPETGQAAWDHVKLDVDGCVCSFAHHIGTTSRPYLEASQHSIHLGVEVMEAARNGHAIPNVICRAHRHRHGIWRDGNLMSCVTGAWQGLTRYGYKVVPAAVPNPSAILLEFKKGCKLPIPHELVFVPEETAPQTI